MKYTIFRGNPRTDKQSKVIKTIEAEEWQVVKEEIDKLKHKLKTDEIYAREEVSTHE